MSLTVEKCIQAWTNSLRQMHITADVVFLGDSLTYYGDFSSVFPDKVVCNLGLRGDTIQGLVNRIDQPRLLNPEKVYLMAGINDVSTNNIEQFRHQYDLLIEQLILSIPDAELIIQNILPVNNMDFKISCDANLIHVYNDEINDIAKRYGVGLIDLYSCYEQSGIMPKSITIDGIHLTIEGYNKWYNLLKH